MEHESVVFLMIAMPSGFGSLCYQRIAIQVTDMLTKAVLFLLQIIRLTVTRRFEILYLPHPLVTHILYCTSVSLVQKRGFDARNTYLRPYNRGTVFHSPLYV